MILAIRTDSMTATITSLSPTGEVIKTKEWEAGRQLSVQLPTAIDKVLASSDSQYSDVTGIIVYEGPGSFTGLRIGITTANAISYAKQIPIVATDGESWLSDGLERLRIGQTDQIALPEYGAPANITMPKK